MRERSSGRDEVRRWQKSGRNRQGGGLDRTGLLFRPKKRIAKRWLLEQVQKIGHRAPTARAPRRAKAAHDPVCGSFAPELVAFSLNARRPVDDRSPHWFGDINSFRIAARKGQRFDGLDERKRDRLLCFQNGRHQRAIGSSNDSASFGRTAQVAVADGVQDRVGELACVARGAERTGPDRADRHSQAKRMTAAQLPDARERCAAATAASLSAFSCAPSLMSRKYCRYSVDQAGGGGTAPARTKRVLSGRAGRGSTRSQEAAKRQVSTSSTMTTVTSLTLLKAAASSATVRASWSRTLPSAARIAVGVGSTAPATIRNRRTPSSSRHVSSAETIAVFPTPAGP